MAEWTASEIAQELWDLFELDSGRAREGWQFYTGDTDSDFYLRLGEQVFYVQVRKERG